MGLTIYVTVSRNVHIKYTTYKTSNPISVIFEGYSALLTNQTKLKVPSKGAFCVFCTLKVMMYPSTMTRMGCRYLYISEIRLKVNRTRFQRQHGRPCPDTIHIVYVQLWLVQVPQNRITVDVLPTPAKPRAGETRQQATTAWNDVCGEY
jgi:hypothetical protein